MFKKVPFSSVLILSILVLALISGSIFKPLPINFVSNVSFDAQDFSFHTYYRIFLMILFSKDPLMLFGLTIISIGCFIYEYKFGTKRALILFFSTHLTGILFILFSYFVRVPLSRYSDVGASIGFWGVSGAVLGYIRYKKAVFLSLVLFLVTYFFLKPGDPANIEHPAAFFSGMIYQKIINLYEKFKK